MRTIVLLLASGSFLVIDELPAQSGTRVDFKFDWRPGTVADVRSVTGMSGMNPLAPADTAATVIRSSRRMTIEKHPQGLAVRNVPVEVAGQPATAAIGTAAAAITAQADYTVLVTTAGRFVGLGDTLRLKKYLDSTLAATQPNLGALPPAVRTSIERLAGMASVTAMTRQSWEQETGQFLERSWTVGEEVPSTVEMPFPMGPGQMLKSTQRTTVLSIAACDSAVPTVLCALVKRTTTLDAAGMRSGMLEMMKNMGMDTANPDMVAALPEMTTEIVADGVLEIKTLLPRRLNQRIVQNLVVGGMSRRTEVNTVTTYNYTSR